MFPMLFVVAAVCTVIGTILDRALIFRVGCFDFIAVAADVLEEDEVVAIFVVFDASRADPDFGTTDVVDSFDAASSIVMDADCGGSITPSSPTCCAS